MQQPPPLMQQQPQMQSQVNELNHGVEIANFFTRPGTSTVNSKIFAIIKIFIFANSVKTHICDVKICDKGLIYLYQ